MIEENSKIAWQIKEATWASRQTDRRYMSLPKIGKLKANDLGDGSTTEWNSEMSALKPSKRRYEATYDHNMDNYLHDLTTRKL